MLITNAVKARGLLYAPDPSSQPACTIRQCRDELRGPHTLKYGVTTNHVLGLELVCPMAKWSGSAPRPTVART